VTKNIGTSEVDWTGGFHVEQGRLEMHLQLYIYIYIRFLLMYLSFDEFKSLLTYNNDGRVSRGAR